jgi:hypothetical protein
MEKLCRGPATYDESELKAKYIEFIELKLPGIESGLWAEGLEVLVESQQGFSLEQEWQRTRLPPCTVQTELQEQENIVPEVVESQPYWRSISRNGFTRIHRVGGCGTDKSACFKWESMSEKVAETDKSDEACQHCWPELKQADSGAASSSSGSTSSSQEECDDKPDQVHRVEHMSVEDSLDQVCKEEHMSVEDSDADE